VSVWGVEYKEELILNITVIFVRSWGVEYREELILNDTLFFVRVWGKEYREEMILNITVCCEGLGRGISRASDTEYDCFYGDGVGTAL
jgi:acyl-CoA thioesterase FadM